MQESKHKILQRLQENHEALATYIEELTEPQFTFSLNDEKWTAGQELLHISKSLGALNKALRMPKPGLKRIFGVANRPSRSYEAVVERYREKAQLADNKTIPAFTPDPIPFRSRKKHLKRYRKLVSRMVRRFDRFNEDELDRYILPHPLLGKLTLREIACFMAFHTEHHMKNSQKNLALRKA